MITTDKFAIFILTYGRPDNQITHKTLQRLNCTADIYFVISTDDKSADRYFELYGDKVIQFDKNEVKGTFDIMDNFDGMNVVVFARNKVNDIAKELGLDYYLVLDDDYDKFEFRMNGQHEYPEGGRIIKDIDPTLNTMLDYFKSTSFDCIAMSQGGDWIGGSGQDAWQPKRKIMNTFFIKTPEPFQFIGRINEDTNTYIENGKAQSLFMQIPFISCGQINTQNNAGGLTDFYLETGTYIKSFYSVMTSPAICTIQMMGNVDMRLHHNIKWNHAVPKIVRESVKNGQTTD